MKEFLNALINGKELLYVKYKQRVPNPGICYVCTIDWVHKCMFISNNSCGYSPDFDEVEFVDGPELPDTSEYKPLKIDDFPAPISMDELRTLIDQSGMESLHNKDAAQHNVGITDPDKLIPYENEKLNNLIAAIDKLMIDSHGNKVEEDGDIVVGGIKYHRDKWTYAGSDSDK